MLARRFPPWAFLIAAVVPILLVLALADPLPKPVIMTLSVLAVLWGGAMASLHWKRLDEAARAAHRWAWYWGGSIGLMAAMLSAVLMLVSPAFASSAVSLMSFMASPRFSPEQIHVAAGILICGIAQGIGFLGAWIYWWAAKR